MLLTKSYSDKTVYCIKCRIARKPGTIEENPLRVITKFGRKYIYINGTKYRFDSDQSTEQYDLLCATETNDRLMIFLSEGDYLSFLEREIMVENIKDMINTNQYSELNHVSMEHLGQIISLLKHD
ncbi:beta barrel domain-containing protein [Photobacterium damselae]|uniref:beta barrel domain-containing protein n=1 Tax=Photobacterium damselae TaxID=38293 RepID=UPI004067EB13